jgi:biofilm PGA synthesis protein PgaD
MSETLIISLPGRQSTAQRSLYASLTALAWVAWISLWLPLLTLFAWTIGLEVAYSRVVLASAEHGVADLVFLARAAACCALSLLAWAFYNRLRYGGPDRRQLIDEIAQPEIAHYFGASVIVSDRLQRARRTVLHVDASGRPVRAVIAPPARPGLPGPAGSDDEHGYDSRPATSGHPEMLAPVESDGP